VNGISWVACPRCGTELTIVDAERGRCDPCRQTYLVGFGHVLALPPRENDLTTEAVPEGTA
jgi:hypothetical protein